MGLIWIAAAVLWAVAEATLFFVVPDVLLTAAVMRFHLGRALRLSALAAVVASIAGIGMWIWGHSDPASARHVLLLIPAIGPDLLARAHSETARNWALHLVTGAMTGVPYKLYAVEAGARGINLLLFVPASFGARFARFALTAILAAAGKEILARLGRPQGRYGLWAAAWLFVYATYFHARGLF